MKWPMRALAITGILTCCMISRIFEMRATPPSLRISDGTRSSAITAVAPAFSAITACSALVTSMITPPFSISARPTLRRKVSSMYIGSSLVGIGGWGFGTRQAGSYESRSLHQRRIRPRAIQRFSKDSAQDGQAGAYFLRRHSGEADAQTVRLRPRHREIPAGQIRHAFAFGARQQFG